LGSGKSATNKDDATRFWNTRPIEDKLQAELKRYHNAFDTQSAEIEHYRNAFNDEAKICADREQEIERLKGLLALEKQKCKEIVDHTCYIPDETGWVCGYVKDVKILQDTIAMVLRLHRKDEFYAVLKKAVDNCNTPHDV
jgi:hypothetical protein